MKVKNLEFVYKNTSNWLKDIVLDVLENLPSRNGVESAKKQVELAEKLREFEDELPVTPEEAVLIRELVNRAIHIPPAIQVGVYEAFDPSEKDV